jgi:hypothetical protein
MQLRVDAQLPPRATEYLVQHYAVASKNRQYVSLIIPLHRCHYMNNCKPTESDALSTSERDHLRALGRRLAQIGNEPEQQTKADMWRRHNDLERVRPMVLVFPEGSWCELLPEGTLRCTNEFWRHHEWNLVSRIYHAEQLQDDNVIEPVIVCNLVWWTSGFGVDASYTRPAEARGAYHFEPVIHTHADVEKIVIPEVMIDWEETQRRAARLHEVFDGILPVEVRGRTGGDIAPVDLYAKWRGIDQLFLDLTDNPAMVHDAVARITDGHIAIMCALEARGGLSLGIRNHYSGSGGTCYTRQLPQPDFDGTHVRLKDQWGFATTQIFSEVSPAMHEEFALRHEERYLALFGLNAYGCCEPLHHKLDAIFRHVPRLRRISISPWADVPKSAAALQNNYVFSWKPNPAVVAGETWEPELVRRGLRTFCEQTRDAIVEMILKDTHTCRHQPQRMSDWVRIAKEVAQEFA